MTTTFKEVTIRHQITEDQVRNLLVSAFEGGSTYWMYILKYEYPPKTCKDDFLAGGRRAVKDSTGEYWHPCYVIPFCEDGAIVLDDRYENVQYTLTRDKMLEGLQIMAEKYPKHFQSIIEDNTDATTADVFLQCSLFNEIVYG